MYASPLLSLSGAVQADGPDAGVAAHYGNPVAEQRRLQSGAGWVDLSHLDVVRVAGADRLTYLHALATQAFDRLAPGKATEALILSPQGHIEHAF
ncbi:MAG: folate-binding protein, partial [Nocardioidaceae bacterium]